MHSRDSNAVEQESEMQDGCEHKSVVKETLRTELERGEGKSRAYVENFIINLPCSKKRKNQI